MRAIAVVGLLFVAGCGTPALPGGPGSVLGPSPDKEGVEWDHKELQAFLKSKGVAVFTAPTDQNTAWGPALIFAKDDTTAEKAGSRAAKHEAIWMSGVCYVQKRKGGPQEAKDEAATVKQKVGFSWGAFLFRTDDAEYADQIRKALNG